MPKNPRAATETATNTYASELPSALLKAFQTNNRINLYLLENLPAPAWREKPSDGKGRTIAAIVAHLHNVRVMWLKAAKSEEIPGQLDRASVTPAQAARGLENSCQALESMITRAIESNGHIKNFRPDVAGFIGYLIAHDAHHRGQIAMLARQLGHPLPQKAMFGMWEWGSRRPACAAFVSGTIQLRVPMRKAALLYNPDSGGSKRRQRELQSALEVLQRAGVEAELVPTDSPEHAGDEARRAIASGCDTIFACGGDGTIHNIAQVLAGSQVALAVLPMGTANALAHDLGLPLHAPAAAEAALTGSPRRIALGRVTCQNLHGVEATRYFVITAGIGVDAHLFYKLHSGVKQRLGIAAYYAKAWHMWFTYPMTRFRVGYIEPGSSVTKNAEVTELLAVRIRHFGGVIREFAPGASLDRDDMRIILCHTRSRLAYLAYVTRCLLGGAWNIPGIELVYSTKASCNYAGSSEAQSQRKIYVEADGELIGSLPAELSVVPDALTLLAPAR
jgi:YegS/Rv2252/BmrU family lipid kinase